MAEGTADRLTDATLPTEEGVPVVVAAEGVTIAESTGTFHETALPRAAVAAAEVVVMEEEVVPEDTVKRVTAASTASSLALPELAWCPLT